MDEYLSYSNPRTGNSILSVLVAVNLGILVGLILAVRIGRVRFFGLSMIIAIGTVMLDAFVIASHLREVETDPHTSQQAPIAWFSFLKDRRVALAALFVTVCLIGILGRHPAYLVILTVFFLSTIVHAATEQNRQSRAVSLLFLMIGTGVVIASQVLTVKYLAFTSDTIVHTSAIRQLATHETLEALSLTRLTNVPLFHLSGSVGVRMTGLSPRLFGAVLFLFLFPVMFLGLYTVFHAITGTPKLGLLAITLVAINPEIIFWGAQSHYQALSFIFMVIYIILLIQPDSWKYKLLAVLVATAWVMTHHLSLVMAIFLLSIPLGVAGLWLWRQDTSTVSVISQPMFMFASLVVIMLSYWGLTGIYRIPIRWILEGSPRASKGLPSDEILIQSYSGTKSLISGSFLFILDNIHLSVFLVLAGIGLFWLYRYFDGRINVVWPVVGSSFVAGMIFYFPNPLWIPLRGVATLSRWGIIALPFVVLVPAFGLTVLYRDNRQTVWTAIAVILIAGLVFTSLGAGFHEPSISNLAGEDRNSQKYFTQENTQATDYVLAHTSTVPISANDGMQTFIAYQQWTEPASPLPDISGEGRFQKISYDATNGRFITTPGLTVIDYRAFTDDQIRVEYTNLTGPQYRGDVTTTAPISTGRASFDIDDRDVVYDNGGTLVFYSGKGLSD